MVSAHKQYEVTLYLHHYYQEYSAVTFHTLVLTPTNHSEAFTIAEFISPHSVRVTASNSQERIITQLKNGPLGGQLASVYIYSTNQF